MTINRDVARRLAIAAAVSLAGCGADSVGTEYEEGVTLLARGPLHPVGVAVDDQFVYWNTAGNPTDEGTSSILRVPKAGGTMTTLATAPYLFNYLAVDGGYLYAAHWPDAVLRMPKGGGALEDVAPRAFVTSGVVVDDVNAYWAVSAAGRTAVMSAGKAGGTQVRQLAEYSATSDARIVADDQWLYLTGSNLDGLHRIPKTGGPLDRIAANRFVAGPSIDGERVYFLACPTSACEELTLNVVAKSGGAVQELARRAGGAEGGIAVAGDDVIWVGRGQGEGFVVRVPKRGGPATPVHEGEEGPFAVAVEADGSAAYWVDFDSGEVYRARLQ